MQLRMLNLNVGRAPSQLFKAFEVKHTIPALAIFSKHVCGPQELDLNPISRGAYSGRGNITTCMILSGISCTASFWWVLS